jgi:Ala-tRNA(Pro) deacylase
MTLQQYLTDNGVTYDTLTHPETPSAARAAELCHVSGDCFAKAVMLKKGDDYLLAIVPASHHLQMGELRRWLQEPVGLATEQELKDLFPDCDVGAIPALGTAYGLTMLVEESLEGKPDIYFEAGDHRTLVHLSGAQFHRLMLDAPHGHFSTHD